MSRLPFPGRRRGAFLYPGAEIHDTRTPRARGTARVAMDGHAKAAVEVGRNRLAITAGVFVLAFCVIAGRLVDLMALNGGETAHMAARGVVQAEAVVHRGDILDRNGIVLATNLPTVNLYADARKVQDPEVAAARLVRVLPDIPFETAREKLSSGRSFVYLRRNLTPLEQDRVNRLGLPGLEFETAERRVYPHGRLAAHVLGATDVDNRGIAGVERAFDSLLGEDNRPLRLSLDVRVQHAVQTILGEAIERFDALAGAAIVADIHTGEILSMASLPDYAPEQYGQADPQARFNRATLGVYEMGSTFKLINTALGLEVGGHQVSDRFDARQPLKMASYVIKDYHPEARWLTIPEILVHSSNIGSARLALSVGGPAQKAFLDRLGLLSPLGIELPESGTPLYPHPWRPINTVTISYGHGIAVTPLHLVNAVSALANGGLFRPATLLYRAPDDVEPARRVIGRETSRTMVELMRLVVTEGTGKQADVPGYLVGGKTGTAEKAGGGGYREKALMPSFVAVFPVDDPRYVVLVTLDEPKGIPETHGFATAGWNAAPTAGAIVARIAPALGVMPRIETIPAPEGLRLAAVSASPADTPGGRAGAPE